VTRALGQSTDRVLGFFRSLRRELAFYLGCLNLHEALARCGQPIYLPVLWHPRARGSTHNGKADRRYEQVAPAGAREHAFRGLYEPCLALTLEAATVANDGDFSVKSLMIVTGANQGGKSTFLRSIGLAQLMLQSGMFVAARSFRADLCSRVFTHFRREEDSRMRSGTLDEELSRMSDIVDELTPDSLLLFNESFAATNELGGRR